MSGRGQRGAGTLALSAPRLTLGKGRRPPPRGSGLCRAPHGQPQTRSPQQSGRTGFAPQTDPQGGCGAIPNPGLSILSRGERQAGPGVEVGAGGRLRRAGTGSKWEHGWGHVTLGAPAGPFSPTRSAEWDGSWNQKRSGALVLARAV